MQEFYKVNFKTPFSVIMMIIFCSLISILFWKYQQYNINLLLYLGFILIAFVLLVIFYSITSKVILTENYIAVRTVFGIRQLNYEEIKTFGVYAASNYIYPLEKEKHDKILFFEQKFIYLSSTPNFLPFFIKRPKGYIDFHYQKEIYDIITS